MEGTDVVMVVFVVLIGLPWLVLHYMTKWKTAATLTNDDETMLEELYQLARRLDERMDTVERLVVSDNPDYQPLRVLPDRETDDQTLRDLEELRALGKNKTAMGRTAK
ncbi:MAG: envelope stress response membrane protein PspB [Sphingomonadaceae bacterium]